MSNLGATEILLIIFILVLLFGAKKIPELMRGLGQGIKSFKKALHEDENNSKKDQSSNWCSK